MKHRVGLPAVYCGVMAMTVAGLAGCAAHPLPQDVSYASTVQIVRRIRCEAKAGLETALEQAALRGPDAKRHAEKIASGTTIGFEFKFQMSENNKAAGGRLEFEREARRAGESFTLALDADYNGDHGAGNNTRSNERFFRIVDDVNELKVARCGRRTREAGPNLVYPITGSTGMAEVVRTYIELEMLTDLRSGAKGSGNKKIVMFSDELDFTTTFEAGVGVDLEVSTVVGSLRLTKASVTGSAFRSDVHSVKVVLARDEGRDVDLPEQIKDVRDKSLQIFLTQTRALARNNVLIELSRQRRAAENRTVAERVLGQPVP